MSIEDIRKSLPALPDGVHWWIEFSTQNDEFVELKLKRGPTLMYSEMVNVKYWGEAQLPSIARHIVKDFQERKYLPRSIPEEGFQ